MLRGIFLFCLVQARPARSRSFWPLKSLIKNSRLRALSWPSGTATTAMGLSLMGAQSFNVLDPESLKDDYVVLGSPEESYMWQRVADGEMPPEGQPSQPRQRKRFLRSGSTRAAQKPGRVGPPGNPRRTFCKRFGLISENGSFGPAFSKVLHPRPFV